MFILHRQSDTCYVGIFYLYSVDVEPPDVLFNPQGYLLLSSKDDVKLMENDHEMQT